MEDRIYTQSELNERLKSKEEAVKSRILAQLMDNETVSTLMEALTADQFEEWTYENARMTADADARSILESAVNRA